MSKLVFTSNLYKIKDLELLIKSWVKKQRWVEKTMSGQTTCGDLSEQKRVDEMSR